MDFLDKIAVKIGNVVSGNRSDKDSRAINYAEHSNVEEKPSEEHIEDVKTSVNIIRGKLTFMSRKNYSEVNFKHDGRVFNDDYNKKSFKKQYDIKDNDLIGKVLPFMRVGEPFVEWVYRNRYGVFVTVGLYLIILFSFFMWRFNLYSDKEPNGIMIDFNQFVVRDIEEPKKEEDKDAEFSPQDKIENLISNELGQNNQENVYEDNAVSSEIKALLNEQEERERNMQGEMESYKSRMEQLEKDTEQERSRAQQARDSLRTKNDIGLNKLQKGNVTVSYMLKDRTALFLEIPSYRCEGGGKVVVSIEVNRKGTVLNASVIQTFGVTDECILDMAIWACKRSLFNEKEDAPVRQTGTITFIFVSQNKLI